jgi:hypothetical protein
LVDREWIDSNSGEEEELMKPKFGKWFWIGSIIGGIGLANRSIILAVIGSTLLFLDMNRKTKAVNSAGESEDKPSANEPKQVQKTCNIKIAEITTCPACQKVNPGRLKYCPDCGLRQAEM